MKKLIFFCLLCVGFTNSYAQDYFRYVDGEKHYFEISPNKFIIQVGEKMTKSAIESFFRKNTSLQVSDISATGHKEFQLVRLYDTNRNAIKQLTDQWKSNDTILHAGYVIIDETGRETAALTNQINIRLKTNNDFPVLQETGKSYDIGKVEQDEFDSRTYLLTVNYRSKKSALQIANELYETGRFEYAEPNLLLFIKYETNDTHFPNQWGLNNVASGIDIKANQAWGITTGSPNIRIAILDSGVDLDHPDLADNMLPGFDATGGSNGGNHSVEPHGTACAGVAAARGNNSRGVAGVAYNSRILPIHMGNAPLANRVANGIDWARTNGARVISMSFGTDATAAVIRALNDATTAEIVLVAASGNNNGTVSYPASRTDVISVGAVTSNGTRWSESYQGSNYGANLNVVAPGGTGIYTTGVLGATGYGTVINNGTNGVYFPGFGGTSAACPPRRRRSRPYPVRSPGFNTGTGTTCHRINLYQTVWIQFFQ